MVNPLLLIEQSCVLYPYAEELGCTKTFASDQGAKKRNKQVHSNVTFPYPVAEKVGCAPVSYVVLHPHLREKSWYTQALLHVDIACN